MVAVLEPLMVYFNNWVVLLSTVVILLVLGIYFLPDDSPSRYSRQGVPSLSLLCNFLIFTLLLHKLGTPVLVFESVCYLIVGLVWSLYRWTAFCIHVRNLFVSKVQDWATENHVDISDIKNYPARGQLTHQQWTELTYSLIRDSSPRLYYGRTDPYTTTPSASYAELVSCFVPQVGANRRRIIVWFLCWPTSALNYFRFDWTVDFANFIFALLRKEFQSIADRVFKNA